MSFNRELFDTAAALYVEPVPFFRPLGERLAAFAEVAPGALVRLHPDGGRSIMVAPHLTRMVRD